MISQNLGESLRRLREAQHTSLRALAEQTGFSASFLSQIENGQCSPSISSMEKIAAALGVTLWQFFQVAHTRSANVIRAASRSQLSLEWSRAEVEALGVLGDGSRFQAAIVRMQPGGLSGKHVRPSIADELVFIHEGEVVLTISDQDQILEKGDSATIPAGVSRRWRNDSQSAAQMLVISVRSYPPLSREFSET
jgi:transcriptional regulator with XRE-family HTH domain